MTERTPNGTSDLLTDDPPPPSTYTIDDTEDPRGQDPGGSNEREPSLLSRLSTGAAPTDDTLERKPSRQKEAALAEKTSKIMSDYQAYLSEIETEFPNNNDEEEAERNISQVREAHRYKDGDVGGTFAPPVEGEYGELHRGWAYNEQGGRLNIHRGADDFEVTQRRGKATRLGSNKRVKRGLVTIALLSFIVVLSVSISNKKKRDSLPDWEAELAESQSQQKGQNPEMHPEMMGPVDSKLNEAEEFQIEEVANRFQPTIYDRKSGWKGQTYIQALSFCQDPNDFKSSRMRVCPYMAICPGGQGSRPITGHLNENGDANIMEYGGSWMPVIDSPNSWVSVGSDNSCVLYSDLHDGATPSWSESGEGNEVNTRHMICCNADAVDAFEEEEIIEAEKKEEEDQAVELSMTEDAEQMSAGVDGTSQDMSGVAMAEEAGFDMNQATQDEISKLQQDGNLPKGEAEALPYVIAAEKYKPVYFDRQSGWGGSTYRDAVQFCETTGVNLHVCPFHAVCPEGLGEMPIRTFNTDQMMWVPVADEQDSWVSVTRKQPCLPFKDQPKWGNDEKVAQAMTEYLVCCTITSDTSGMILGVADLTGTPATTAAEALVSEAIAGVMQAASDSALEAEQQAQSEALKEQSDHAYESVARIFEPLVHDRNSGWTGQTFLEALDFCAKADPSAGGQRSICPLAAICPMGKGSNPITGPKDGPNGDFSWVPISDDANAWVQVSSTNTCLTYSYMNSGESPQWGLDGNGNEELTRYLYCCLTEPSTGVEVTGADTQPETVELTPSTTEASAVEPVETVTGITTAEEEELYATAAQAYQPLVYNRDTTPAWTGQAYLEAIQFCASQDSRVPCPYMALCPAGPGKVPSGGIVEGFSPLLDHPNSWVSVGPTDTCKLYSEINGGPPEWGLTGEGDPDLTQSIVCCLDLEDDKSEETSEAENNVSNKIVMTETEQAIADNFKPEWFGRGAGYQGSSYLDAIDFCSNVAGKSLCPLMAYCPNGEQPSLYLQLDPFDGEAWAPIKTPDGNVGYAMIGTYEGDKGTTCQTYDEITGVGVPVWGLDGTSEELKPEILCCHDPTFSNQGIITPTVEDDLNTPVVQTADTPLLEDGSFDLEGAVNLDLQPLWLDEEDGWEGGSHDDAEAFCTQTVGRSLCPYAAYCPHGPGQPVLGGHDVDFTTEGVQWAPVYGTNNHWVLLSRKGGNSATTCMSHTDLEGSEPDWGLSDARPWLKRHILCCNLKDGF